jgi:hypothetical protein
MQSQAGRISRISSTWEKADSIRQWLQAMAAQSGSIVVQMGPPRQHRIGGGVSI